MEYRTVTAYTATRPILVNDVDINTGLYPVLNFKPAGAQYPYIYVPITEFGRVGAKVEWDPVRQVIIVTSDYEQIKNRITQLKVENERLRNIISEQPETALRGNTAGNIINWGLAAEQNGWVYFSNIRDNHSLYKMKLDGTDITKLGSEDVISINVLGDWIYFVSRTDQFGIFKMKTDGTGRIRIGQHAATLISVIGSWIYYAPHSEYKRIYKIRTDGTGLTRIGEDINTNNLNVIDDWIYYTTEADNNNIIKIRTDGLERTKVNNDNSDEINVVNGWIYYDNASAGGALYKIRTDGTEKTKLRSGSPGHINATKDWIYFGHDDLYKIRSDGSEETLLDEYNYTRLPNVIGDWIFFETFFSTGAALYKMKTDGTQGSVILTKL